MQIDLDKKLNINLVHKHWIISACILQILFLSIVFSDPNTLLFTIIILPYAHGTQYVQENKGAVCIIISRQVSVAQTLYPWYRIERKFSHNSSIKSVKHIYKDCYTTKLLIDIIWHLLAEITFTWMVAI